MSEPIDVYQALETALTTIQDQHFDVYTQLIDVIDAALQTAENLKGTPVPQQRFSEQYNFINERDNVGVTFAENHFIYFNFSEKCIVFYLPV